MHTITVTLGSESRTVRDTDINIAREEAHRIADEMLDRRGCLRADGTEFDDEPALVETNDEEDVFANTTMGPTPSMIAEAERAARKTREAEVDEAKDGAS